MGVYVGAPRRRVHLATVLSRPLSGHSPGRRRARHVRIPEKTPPDASMKHVDATSAWFSHLDLGKKQSDRWDP